MKCAAKTDSGISGCLSPCGGGSVSLSVKKPLCIIPSNIFQVFLALTAGGSPLQNKALDQPVGVQYAWIHAAEKLRSTFQSFSPCPSEQKVVVKGTEDKEEDEDERARRGSGRFSLRWEQDYIIYTIYKACIEFNCKCSTHVQTKMSC